MRKRISTFMTAAALLGALAGYAAAGPSAIPLDHNAKITGVIVEIGKDELLVRETNGNEIVVALRPDTTIVEKKSNPFRDPKDYGHQDLVVGLRVIAKGRGDADGRLQAESVKFTQDDLEIAETLAARLGPIDRQLEDAAARLSASENHGRQMQGQVEELNEGLRVARGQARGAQETADEAIDGVQAANTRIESLDEYDSTDRVDIHFAADSHELSAEARESLDQFAERINTEKGFLLEVSGFASSDGDEAYNRRLSERRARQVMRYLSEERGIPLRRIISPYGFGENRPLADNSSVEGRRKNRRVEVRLLLNRGLQNSATGSQIAAGAGSSN